MTLLATFLLALLAVAQVVFGALAMARAISFDHAPMSLHVECALGGTFCLVTAVAILWLVGKLETAGGSR